MRTVAPGIAEALIATALGLFAAIPAAVFYNYFGHSHQRDGRAHGGFFARILEPDGTKVRELDIFPIWHSRWADRADWRNGRRRFGAGNGALSEINIVPLVDVVLVLLIIFMLTAHVMEFGLEINVPKTGKLEEYCRGTAGGQHHAQRPRCI